MLNSIRFSTMFLGYRARRAGVRDARSLVPHPAGDLPPKYLLYLRDIGHWRAAHLEWSWRLRDLVLWPVCVRALRQREHACDRLEKADAECARAEAQRLERGTDRNIKALRRWTRIRDKARRAAQRADLVLSEAQARRQSKWEEFGARFHALAAEMDHYMQIYSDANVKERDNNDCPPGLLEERRPRLEKPDGLRTLNWEAPARGVEGAQAPGAGGPTLPV